MQQLRSFFTALIQWPLKIFIKSNPVAINIVQEIKVDTLKPVVYLLQTKSLSDQIALTQACQQLGLPEPGASARSDNDVFPKVMFLEQPESLFKRPVAKTKLYQRLSALITDHKNQPDLDVQIIPVSLCWGRTPERSPTTWAGLLADRASPNWLRKMAIVLLLGRDNFVSFSPAVSLRSMTEQHSVNETVAKKLARVARVHFFRRRQAMTGPNHIDKQQLINAILATDSVKQALKTEQTSKQLTNQQAKTVATNYVKEIAADYNDSLVRLSDRILKKVWNKIYNGIEVHHAQHVRELANSGHEIIYVPCHRSHMDYILLTYVIYHQGLVTPHIAAGINLNFWPVGSFFRRAGAFFLRRSFGGNKVYTAVFKEYLDHLFSSGVPVKFYPEGGRSRTGRLLSAKTGMLGMTLQSAMRNNQRPISLVPVYIGYEHVMEVGSYLKELKGKTKKKESLWQTFSALKNLKNYGYGYLNFGKPISLNSFTTQYQSETSDDNDKRPSWFNQAVADLAGNVMEGINHTVALNNMTFCSVCLLASKQHALQERDLKSVIGDYVSLLENAPYSSFATLPKNDPDKIVEHAISLNKFSISEDSFGRIIGFDEQAAIAHTYYRNNVMHVFALPALIAAAVIQHNGIEKAQLIKIIEAIFPLLKRELFIHFDSSQANDYANTLVKEMKQGGLLLQSGRKIKAPENDTPQYLSLSLLNNLIQDTLQRYAIVLSNLSPDTGVSRSELEAKSVKVAERLSALHGINAPEYYDKNVLKGFVAALREADMVVESAGSISHAEQSLSLQSVIITLINGDIAQSIASLK